MPDLCHATRYIRMSSNPTESFLEKFFPHSLFGDVHFHVLFFIIFAYCFFFFFFFFFFYFCVFLLLYCIILYFFNITMKFQDASWPSLAVGVLKSSVESQSLAVSVSF